MSKNHSNLQYPLDLQVSDSNIERKSVKAYDIEVIQTEINTLNILDISEKLEQKHKQKKDSLYINIVNRAKHLLV